MFKGSFNSQIQENHVFLSDDPVMEAIGLASFTNKSFRDIISNNLDGIKLVYPALGNFLDNISNDGLLIDLVDPNPGTYRKFNTTSQAYETEEISVSEVKDLIEYHELKSKTPNSTIDEIKDEDKDNKIIGIQNSLTNSILFKLPKSAFGINDDSNPDIRFNLYFTKSNQSNNKRIMAQKGPPMIVGVPRRSTGGTYGFRATKSTQQSDEGNNIGAYEIASNDGIEDMQNTVGAPLKLTYNQNTKLWESGTTQILAKLTEDVAAAEIKNVQIGPSDIDSITGSESFYVADSQYYMGGHVTTLAIPLSLENGNPNLFGPNILKCKNGKCETIRAVNRAPRSFSAGSVVLLSNIDGEWIIQDFGANPADLKPSKTSFGEWSFIKLIADSDAYFKDERFFTQGDTVNTVLPQTYEYQSRLKFYSNSFSSMVDSSILQEIYNSTSNAIGQIIALNIDVSSPDKVQEFIASELTLQPSTRYYISTIFDQIAKTNGGFSEKTYISKTNLKASEFGGEGGILASQVPIFWGPVFVDGYKKLSTNVQVDQVNRDKYFYIDVNVAGENPNDAISIPSDITREHIPAEMTTKIIDIIPTISNWNNLGRSTITQNYIVPPFYGSIANSTNRIQFSPLQVDLAAHDDPISKLSRDQVRQYYDNLRNFIEISDSDTNLWGNMYNRSVSTYLPFSFSQANEADLFARLQNCAAYDNLNNPASIAAWRGSQFVAYDCFIRRRPTNVPVGTPQEFRNGDNDFRGANLVGVVAAKQTIVKPRGGTLNFSCEQNFGLNQQRTVAGSAGSISIIGGVILGAISPSLKQYGTPQWGSSLSDRYDSFGTTALHVRIFDYWPEENTIYDPRYYAVLHFNPGQLYSAVDKKAAGLQTDADIKQKYGDQYSLNILPPKIAYADIPRSVDQTTVITNSIDIRIPTYGIKFEDNSIDRTEDNNIVNVGSIIDSTFWPLRPNNEWRINPIRRGQMLTEGGFNYLYHAIGLGDVWKITKIGSGFENGQKLTLAGSKSIEIELITNNSGEITGFNFISTNESLNSENGRGNNFMPSDFGSQSSVEGESRKCYKLNIPAPEGGESATIEFYSGIVYLRHGLDSGPQQKLSPTLISSSSKQGEGFVTETKESQLTLDENDSDKYDCFYFFHNDVTHTPLDPFTFTAGFAQHITLTVS